SRSRRPGAVAQARKPSASRPGSRRRRPRSSRKNLARSNSGKPTSARSGVLVLLMVPVVLKVLVVLVLEPAVSDVVAAGVGAGGGAFSPDGRNMLGWPVPE